MARILGLDLGSHSVKGVVLEAKTKGHITRGYAEVRRAPEGERLDTLRAALQELLGQLPPGHADQVVIALPGPSLTTHALTLPFSEAKHIEATLPEEVGSLLPFDISQVVYDYQIVGQKDVEGTKTKTSDLLVGVVRKEELQGLLALLAELKLDPRVITHPGLAYQNLLTQQPGLFEGAGEGGALAIVDIGHERTSVSFGKPGVGVQFARTFAGGGRDLSKALATEFQTSLAEAHHWKEQHGAMASAAQGPDAERAAAAFLRGLQPLLRELRPTLKSFTARTRQQVGAVVLTGGSARMPGLAEQLSKDLNLPVRVLALPADAEPIPAASHPAAAQAYALALRGNAAGARAPRFNLRRGEFAFKGDFDYMKDKLGLLASFAATLLLLLIAFGVVRNSVLARREAQVDAVLCDTTQRILGRCEKDYNRALNMLKGVESPAAALPKLSAVNLLAEVTQRVPEDVPVKFDRIQIDLDRLILQGETDSSKQVDTLSNAIKGHNCFKDVRQGKVERTRDGNKVTFRLDVQVQCPGGQGGES